MNTSKLFHTVVILGMSMAAESACSSDSSPAPAPTTADASTHDAGTVSDPDATAAGDAFAGWFCCG